MNTINYKSGKYTYRVTYRLICCVPKFSISERIIPKIRPSRSIYFDKNDDIFKEIVYPEELHNTEILQNDPVEEYINSLTGFIPYWTKIEII